VYVTVMAPVSRYQTIPDRRAVSRRSLRLATMPWTERIVSSSGYGDFVIAWSLS